MNSINKTLLLSVCLLVALLLQGSRIQAEPAGQSTPAPDAAIGPAAAPGTDSEASLHVDAPLSTNSPRIVLKHGDSLLVLDRQGMIDPRAGSPFGLYEDDTRYLSCWQIKINGKAPNLLAAFDTTGWQGTFLYNIQDRCLVKRDIVLLDGLSERISIQNLSSEELDLTLDLQTGCDFKDMFEVRGQRRKNTGQQHAPELVSDGDGDVLVNSYDGLDGHSYKTFVRSTQKPASVRKNAFQFTFRVPVKSEKVFEFRVSSNRTHTASNRLTYAEVHQTAQRQYDNWKQDWPTLETDWSWLDMMYSRSLSDLYMLQQNTPKGPCMAAGLPWFAAAFGRDQCLVGMQTLPFVPDLSRNLIALLAAYQGKVDDSITEEQPGKIMHELRLGEMARCKEIAFTPYYGTVDATPLWLVLLTRYIDATGNLELAKSLWPNVEATLAYIDKHTSEKNPFLYYGGKTPGALTNQGWKDSSDSIMHKDGGLAHAPIAVCEVQGYLYEAYMGSAKLASRLEKSQESEELLSKAANLKQKFHKSFWLTSDRFVALALDGAGKPCEVVSSNPGHLLSSGILDQTMVAAVAKRMLENNMYSGWGVRTLSSSQARYNPISYHNGTVWPHDNAMFVEGLCKSQRSEQGAKVFQSLLDSAKASCDDRLPELFCGFDRREYDRPVPYPVSCVPQAWAAGSVMQMVQSVLGIRLVGNEILVSNPVLPEKLTRLTIGNLRSQGRRISLTFRKDEKTGKVTWVRKG